MSVTDSLKQLGTAVLNVIRAVLRWLRTQVDTVDDTVHDYDIRIVRVPRVEKSDEPPADG